MYSKHIALGGLLTALTLIILYLTLLIPTNTLTLLTLASFMVPIALMRCNLKTATLVYISSSILSLILLPINISLLYMSFFGCYGILKSLIERLNSLPLEWLLKLTFFNIIFFIILNLTEFILNVNWFDTLKSLANQFLPTLEHNYFILLWLCGQLVFIIFDYALTLLVDMYYKYLG